MRRRRETVRARVHREPPHETFQGQPSGCRVRVETPSIATRACPTEESARVRADAPNP